MTKLLLMLLSIALVWPAAGCRHREKRSVTIEGPESKTEVEVTKEKK